MFLDALALSDERFKTDKASPQHDYLTRYEEHFDPLRYRPVRVLELGVGGGGSIRLWAAYFGHGERLIVGVDQDLSDCGPDRPNAPAPSERIEYVQADYTVESNRPKIVRFAPFDIVIDDGDHSEEAQLETLTWLLPSVRDGGLYIIEDINPNNLSLLAVLNTMKAIIHVSGNSDERFAIIRKQ